MTTILAAMLNAVPPQFGCYGRRNQKLLIHPPQKIEMADGVKVEDWRGV
ncbi:MAG TPA: hypothetical protein VK493_05015 [Bryobacteraceae bacterium]|nr:hypothetical protein [Bryobacteraceae bacterium]